jgi:hypothetical protein
MLKSCVTENAIMPFIQFCDYFMKPMGRVKKCANLLVGLGIICWISLTPQIANAFRFSEERLNGLIVLNLDGEIGPNDGEEFSSIATKYFSSHVVIVLSGPGGNLFAGLSIGEKIKSRGWGTFVASHSECASVCGLIWLAGSPRLIGETGKVGFHAAYIRQLGEVRETGSGNAMVGAYLTKLGLPYSAVLYMTSAAPEDMQWLNDADATRLGIKLSIIPDTVTKTTSPPTVAVSQVPPAGTPTEQRAMKFIIDYYSLWSGITPATLIAQTYAETIDFYGKNTSRSQLMAEKMKFSNRWPTRLFNIRDGSLRAQCSESDCLVRGVVVWDTTSPTRNVRSIGSANFAFQVHVNQADGSTTSPLIWSENGSVIARQSFDLESKVASTPSVGGSSTEGAASIRPPETNQDSYARGVVDRRAYETWFGSLIDERRQGAGFWAENRSRAAKGQKVICDQPGMAPLWIWGCTEAKGMLATYDQRRLSDVDYRAGWNSLP